MTIARLTQFLTALGILILALIVCASLAQAKQIAVADHGGVRLVLTDEKCTLKEVSNLPQRATWTEGGKVHEGCFSASGGIVVTFWSDGSVVLVPAQAFKRVSEV